MATHHQSHGLYLRPRIESPAHEPRRGILVLEDDGPAWPLRLIGVGAVQRQAVTQDHAPGWHRDRDLPLVKGRGIALDDVREAAVLEVVEEPELVASRHHADAAILQRRVV